MQKALDKIHHRFIIKHTADPTSQIGMYKITKDHHVHPMNENELNYIQKYDVFPISSETKVLQSNKNELFSRKYSANPGRPMVILCIEECHGWG